MAIKVRIADQLGTTIRYPSGTSWYVEENGNLVVNNARGVGVAELAHGYWLEVRSSDN